MKKKGLQTYLYSMAGVAAMFAILVAFNQVVNLESDRSRIKCGQPRFDFGLDRPGPREHLARPHCVDRIVLDMEDRRPGRAVPFRSGYYALAS